MKCGLLARIGSALLGSFKLINSNPPNTFEEKEKEESKYFANDYFAKRKREASSATNYVMMNGSGHPVVSEWSAGAAAI